MDAILTYINMLHKVKCLIEETDTELTLNGAIILHLVNKYKKKIMVSRRFPKDSSYTHRQLVKLEDSGFIARINEDYNIEYALTRKGIKNIEAVSQIIEANQKAIMQN